MIRMADPAWWGLLAGTGGGVAGTWLVRSIARARGIVAKPNPIIPQHHKPTAYLGGVGIAIGFAAALFALRTPLGGESLAAIVPALGFLVLGLVDDLRPLRALPKLIVGTGLATVAVLLGLSPTITGVALIDAALAIGWIVLVVNAANVTDVCDGLAGGIAAVGLLYLGLVVPASRPMAWGLAGACLGFLVFNRPPASIFMGDAGSLLLGFALAALSLRVFEAQPVWPGLAMAAAPCALFVFEAFFLIMVRRAKGLPFWKGSPDHFSLRMQAAGWSKWRTDLVSWAAAAGTCALAWLMPAWPLAGQVSAVAVVIAASWGFASWLLRHEVPPRAATTVPASPALVGERAKVG
jgi:UDP-GlcNAc:undecaprenyl-phosphate GlcNAc-1-phosphate transferase